MVAIFISIWSYIFWYASASSLILGEWKVRGRSVSLWINNFPYACQKMRTMVFILWWEVVSLLWGIICLRWYRYPVCPSCLFPTMCCWRNIMSLIYMSVKKLAPRATCLEERSWAGEPHKGIFGVGYEVSRVPEWSLCDPCMIPGCLSEYPGDISIINWSMDNSRRR